MPVQKGENQDQTFMQAALAQAALAATLGEIPIGAVIVHQGKVIAAAHNQIESAQDASAHAEMLVIRKASEHLKNWRLENCDLFVTLEPCPMCLGALRLSRIRRIVVAALESRMGAITHFSALISDTRLGPTPIVETGLLKEESQLLLQDFFKDLRSQKGPF